MAPERALPCGEAGAREVEHAGAPAVQALSMTAPGPSGPGVTSRRRAPLHGSAHASNGGGAAGLRGRADPGDPPDRGRTWRGSPRPGPGRRKRRPRLRGRLPGGSAGRGQGRHRGRVAGVVAVTHGERLVRRDHGRGAGEVRGDLRYRSRRHQNLPRVGAAGPVRAPRYPWSRGLLLLSNICCAPDLFGGRMDRACHVREEEARVAECQGAGGTRTLIPLVIHKCNARAMHL